MTEAQLLSEIFTVTGTKKSDIALILGGFWGLLKRELVAGNSVTIKGVGRFESRIHSGRRAYDINNRRKCIIPPRWRISFIPCESLRAKLAAKSLVHPKPQPQNHQTRQHQDAQPKRPQQSKTTSSVMSPTSSPQSSNRPIVIRRRGVDRIYESATAATDSR